MSKVDSQGLGVGAVKLTTQTENFSFALSF